MYFHYLNILWPPGDPMWMMTMAIIIVAVIIEEKWNELPHGDKMYTNEKHLPC